jgi:hypothetical protein
MYFVSEKRKKIENFKLGLIHLPKKIGMLFFVI